MCNEALQAAQALCAVATFPNPSTLSFYFDTEFVPVTKDNTGLHSVIGELVVLRGTATLELLYRVGMDECELHEGALQRFIYRSGLQPHECGLLGRFHPFQRVAQNYTVQPVTPSNFTASSFLCQCSKSCDRWRLSSVSQDSVIATTQAAPARPTLSFFMFSLVLRLVSSC